MSQTLKINYNKIGQQIAEIEKIAKEKKWEFFYDEDVDNLYYAPKKITKEFSLFSVSNEFSIYVDEESNVGGVFIEYYKSNLGSHEKAFKPYINVFTKSVENGKTVPKSKKEKAIQLSETIKAELLSDMIISKKVDCFIDIPA